MVDGAFGEVLTTCEKLAWTIKNGEAALAPEYRGVGMIMMHKTARVEYHPLGVLGAIIPWNYPFHNMYGQLISALFAGNAIVIKVSEHASWSADYYVSIVHEALRMMGYSPDLVQIVHGYGQTGASLVKSGVDKLTFVGLPAQRVPAWLSAGRGGLVRPAPPAGRGSGHSPRDSGRHPHRPCPARRSARPAWASL